VSGHRPADVRERSLTRVRELGLPTHPALPYVDEPVLRSEDEAIDRTLALHCVLARVFGAPDEMVRPWLEAERLLDALSPLERLVVDGMREQAPWQSRVECLWAFLWSLGHHDELDPTKRVPKQVSDMLPFLPQGEPAEAFRRRSRLRTREEIYEQADLHYLLTWGARQGAVDGDGARVEGTAVFERRRALDWLIDPERIGWDDISLDT
jgi:hypothetical protein